MKFILIAIGCIHLLSFLCTGLIIFEYRRIHSKRIALLHALKADHIDRELLERKVLIGIYMLLTFCICVGTVLLSFSVLS